MASVMVSTPAERLAPTRWRQAHSSAPATRVDTGWFALAAAVVLAASPLAQGYFNFEIWGALGLVLLVIVVVLLLVTRPTLRGSCAVATAGIGLLLVLSAASWIWAESREGAWTDTNRLVFYCAVFAIVLLAVK